MASDMPLLRETCTIFYASNFFHFLLPTLTMISQTSKKRRGKLDYFVLESVAAASSLIHPNLLNLLVCVVLNFTPQDDMKIPAGAGKASSTAHWTRMVQPMEQTTTRLSSMAQQMVATSKDRLTLLQQRMASTTANLTRMASPRQV
jgi:hypothetical protein